MQTFSTRSSCGGDAAAEASASSASSSTIGQTATPIAASASSSGWNCGQQRRLDALASLVAGPEVVAERLDHVVGRDADVGRACSIICSTVCSTPTTAPKRRVLALVEAALAVEVAEQLVGAVDEMDDEHAVGISVWSSSRCHHVATLATVRLGDELLQVRVGREASRLVLGVGQLAIHHDVELAALADLYSDGAAASRLKPSLHTEDFGFVASGSAVVDHDGHVDGACSMREWLPEQWTNCSDLMRARTVWSLEQD